MLTLRKNWLCKLAAWLLCFSLIFASWPLASASPLDMEAGVCNHQHDADCGYTADTPCLHEHDAGCGGSLTGDLDEPVVITGFDPAPYRDPADPENTLIMVGMGTPASALPLPMSLAATAEGGDEYAYIVGVSSWTCTQKTVDWEYVPGDYDPDTSGVYVFTPELALKSNETLADGVAAPEIEVVVIADGDIQPDSVAESNVPGSTEDFENNGSIPNFWSDVQVSTYYVPWDFEAGSGSPTLTAAHGGNYNAVLINTSDELAVTQLVMPSLDLSLTDTTFFLTFWHAQEADFGFNDTLRVMYSTNGGTSWDELASYTEPTTGWEQRRILLPAGALTSDTVFAFEGMASEFGYGVCIDDVAVTQLPAAETAYLGTLEYSVNGDPSIPIPNFSPTTFNYNPVWLLDAPANANVTLDAWPVPDGAVTQNLGVTLSGGTGTATVVVTSDDASEINLYIIYFAITSYHTGDVAKVKAFLKQSDGTNTNAQKLSAFGPIIDPDDPTTWGGFTSWTEGTVMRLETFDTSMFTSMSVEPLHGTLDLSGCDELEVLDCSNNLLTSVNVSNCTALVALTCDSNALTSLNVTGCSALFIIDCSRNFLTTLNVSGNAFLGTLYAYYNPLNSATLSAIKNNAGISYLMYTENGKHYSVCSYAGKVITVESVGGGIAQGDIDFLGDVSLIASPENGYDFNNWTNIRGLTIDDDISDAPNVSNPGSTMSITANFKRDTSVSMPKIISITPSGSGVSASVNKLVVTFDMPMDTLSGKAFISNGALLGRPVWSNGDKTVTYSLSGLSAGKTYNVSLQGFYNVPDMHNPVMCEAKGTYTFATSGGGSRSGGSGGVVARLLINSASVQVVINGQNVEGTLGQDGMLVLTYTEDDIKKYADNDGPFEIIVSGQNNIALNIDIPALGDDDLVIKTDFGTLTIPNGTLQRLMTLYGDTLRLVITKGSFKFELPDGKMHEAVFDDPAHPFTIVLPFTLSGGQNASAVVAVKKDGGRTIIPHVVYENGGAAFTISAEGTYDLIYNLKDFTDTLSHWAKDNIAFVSARELFSGTGGGLFSPDSSMTRAMFATVLARLDGVNLSGYTTSRFADVPLGQWYSAAVEWAADSGIVAGVGDNEFAPYASITREQMAVMLYKYIQYKGYRLTTTGMGSDFADAGSMSAWSSEAVGVTQAAGVINGKPNNLFDPQGTATRAEVATVYANFIKHLAK